MVLKLIGDNPSGPFAPILSDTPVKKAKIFLIKPRLARTTPE